MDAFQRLLVLLFALGLLAGGCAVGCGMKYGDSIRSTAAEWIAPTKEEVRP